MDNFKSFLMGSDTPTNSDNVSSGYKHKTKNKVGNRVIHDESSSSTVNEPSEPEKAVSPALSNASQSTNTPSVTKLKKAWLQRHSDEDNHNKSGPATATENKSDTDTPRNNSPGSDLNVSGVLSLNSNNNKNSLNSNPNLGNTTTAANKAKAVSNSVSLNGFGSDSSAEESESISDSDRDSSPLAWNKKSKKRAMSSKPSVGGKKTKMDKTSREKDDSPHRKKRGRKPKIKLEKDNGPYKKANNSFNSKIYEKPSMARLKKTGESFLQDGNCCEVAPKLSRCRECKMTANLKNKKAANIFCRFYQFRRLKYNKNGLLSIAGFSRPDDASQDDLRLWIPNKDSPPEDLNVETSKFILENVGDQFCDLVEQERDAKAMNMAEDQTVAWKCVLNGFREMCDVCETTLFNFHWVCSKCGFVVCIDCYKARKTGKSDMPGRDRDQFNWLFCNGKQGHEQNKLMLTQIIAGNSLFELGKMIHGMRKHLNITAHCQCYKKEEAETKPANGICKKLEKIASKGFEIENGGEGITINGSSEGINKSKKKASKVPVNGTVKKEEPENDTSCSVKKEEPEDDTSYSSSPGSPLDWLAEVAATRDKKADEKPVVTNNNNSDGEESSEHFSTLRELLIRPTGNNKNSPNQGQNTAFQPIRKTKCTLEEVISCVVEQSMTPKSAIFPEVIKEMKLNHYIRKCPGRRKGRDPLPIRIFTLKESMVLFPDVPHSWLCNGKLLKLQESGNVNNIKLFQEMWKRGQPVLVASVCKNLDMNLWHPDSFARDFGNIKNDLVNCHDGSIVPNQPMRIFWEGFENFGKRMKDKNGDLMLLKLKDWPPGEDFSVVLPARFSDLMASLPLSQYTHRTGRLNLAGRLPLCFVPPDLGPKMYNAYGSALFPSKGTTNLHLDISDAVNVMVYVGIPKDGDSEKHIQEALRAIDDAGCDIITRRRVREKGECPGALWHIYNSRDADKIRDLLNKIATERGEVIEPHHDPIHDQSWYLDSLLRERLYREYGVEGYAIAQCRGDAVFIPAGAPHQVRNLHSCVKVAEDFVSPENVSHCFSLTQEFRDLSDTHTNHEDKLQVKNIIYHAVRDAMARLIATDGRKTS